MYFQKKMEILNWRGGGGGGRGAHNYGTLRAWGVTHFGISEGKGGGVKTWKPSMVGYRYFLELPIAN